MDSPEIRTSLRRTFRALSLRWVTIGFFLTLLVSAFFYFNFSRRSADHRLSNMAEAVSRSFRPNILDRDIRNVQLQMRKVLNLGDGENAIIRDPNFQAIYPPDGDSTESTCNLVRKVCWNFKGGTLTYLYPVYFNEDLKDSLFGYV